ncbi:zinc finger and BTB domain-containing protein 49 [Drosophila pseudoobscura]|uniref:Zinc finger and BTB domain-containing protein 49 n=1 Tax=Drosophila pseudoobscura pseudoobscura TaxID=46245 RepID=A0A6I8VJB5_DROPS|nr:zinc finger and BTB domain-containing protein 49 [Drosophila pseudoobscura]
MANVPVPMPSVLKTANKTNGDSVAVAASSTAAAALGDNEDSEESELEEDDDLLDDPDDVVLQIDSEDEAELEAQRIRLDDMKAAAAAAAAETAATTTESQVSNGNQQKQQHQQQNQTNDKAASRKPRGRPPGTGNKKKQKTSSSPQASTASSLVAAQVLADEKSYRFFYKCTRCCNHYGDGLSLSRHFQKEHSEQDCHQVKRKRGRSKVSPSGIESTPPLNLSTLNVGCLKPCAQLLIQGESLLQLCLACNSQFVDVKHFQHHLSEQHGFFKLLVPKEEPTEVPPTAMVTIPAAIAMSKSSQQLQLPIPAPDTPPPEQDGKEPSGTGSCTDKDDLDIINAMVAKMAAERGKPNCAPKVNKMIIKLPGVAKRGKKCKDQEVKTQRKEREQESPESVEKPEKKNQEKPDQAVPDPLQRPEEPTNPPKRKRACKQLSPSPSEAEKEIKKETEPSERRMRKTRNFVDYVMDVKDEEDEDENEEESEGSSATVSPHNSSSDESLASIKRESIEESQSTGRPIHTCNFCGKTFQRFSRMQDHLRIHTGEKPFICNHCGKAFRLKMRLAEHKLRHRTEKAYQCEICSMPLATKQDLSLHMRHHKNDRRYKCDKCDKGFVRSSDLAIHVRIHTGEKPYACDLCGKAFRARQNLVVHRRTHLGDKPVQCELCDKRFARKIDMRVHMRKHTGEKPFNCESCQRGYSSRVNLQRHQEREHGKGSQKPQRTKTGQGKEAKPEEGNESIPEKEAESKTEKGTEPKDKANLRRPRREKLQQKIAAQEKLLNDLKRSLRSLPDIPEESSTGKNELDMSKFPADAGAGCVPPAQVSVTVSMQVEAAANVEDDEITPEKENALSSGSPVDGKSKTNRKITSYFTVVGQQAEMNNLKT